MSLMSENKKNEVKNLKYFKKNKNVYLLFGEEKYLIKQAFDEIVDNVVYSQDKTMNIDFYEGKDVSINNIIDSIETLTFFAENRCVVVRDTGFLKKSANADIEGLVDAIVDVPDTTYVVFIEDVDKSSVLYKAVKKEGVAYEFSTPKENELISFVESKVKNKKCKIDRATTIYFLRTVENDMIIVDNELEKLIAYTLFKNRIEKDDIDKICTKSLQVEIFKLMDAIGNKNVQLTLEIYNDMMFVKEPVLRILSMLARQVKLILLSKELSEAGYNFNEISAKIGVHSFVVKGCIKQSKNFTKNKLVDSLLKLSELETNIKTGKIKDVIGLETLIVSMF